MEYTLEQLIEARDLLNVKIEEKQKNDKSLREKYLALIFCYSGAFDEDSILEKVFVDLFIDEIEDFSIVKYYTIRHGYHTDHVRLKWLWDTFKIEYLMSEHGSYFYSSQYRKDGEIEKLLNVDKQESLLLAYVSEMTGNFKQRLKLFVTYHLFEEGIYELISEDTVWIKDEGEA